MRSLSALLSWLLAACAPRASTADPPVSASFKEVARLGAGSALAVAALQDGALVVGTTRGLAVFDGTAQRWSSPSQGWARSVSAGGGRVAVGTASGVVEVRDAATGSPVLSQELGKSAVVALSPDGQRLAVGIVGEVRVISVDSGDIVSSLNDFTADISGLAWSPDGARLAAADRRGRVLVLEGGASRALSGASAPTGGLAWSPDGARLAAAGRPVVVWDVAEGAVVSSLTPGPGRTERLAWSPDGARLAGGRERGQVDVWTLADGAIERTLTALGTDTPDLVWTSSALWAGRGAVGALDVGTGTRGVTLPLLPTPNEVRVIEGCLAVGSASAVALWDARSLAPLGAMAAETGPLRVLGGSGDGLWTAEAAGLGRAARSGGAPSRVAELKGLGAAALAPDGARLLGARYGEDGQWSLFVSALPQGEARWQEPLGRAPPLGVAWVGTGAFVVAQTGGAVQAYDAATGRARGRRDGVINNAAGMAASPTDAVVASVSQDRWVELWDPATGRTVRRLGQVAGSAGSQLAWSADGQQLAVAARAGSGDLVNIAGPQGGLGGVLPGVGPSAVVHDLAWSPDHALLAAAVGDRPNQGQITVWTRAGALVQSLPVLDATPNAVAWDPDGARLYAALGDGTAMVLERVP